jgi:hypothetical protein
VELDGAVGQRTRNGYRVPAQVPPRVTYGVSRVGAYNVSRAIVEDCARWTSGSARQPVDGRSVRHSRGGPHEGKPGSSSWSATQPRADHRGCADPDRRVGSLRPVDALPRPAARRRGHVPLPVRARERGPARGRRRIPDGRAHQEARGSPRRPLAGLPADRRARGPPDRHRPSEGLPARRDPTPRRAVAPPATAQHRSRQHLPQRDDDGGVLGRQGRRRVPGVQQLPARPAPPAVRGAGRRGRPGRGTARRGRRLRPRRATAACPSTSPPRSGGSAPCSARTAATRSSRCRSRPCSTASTATSPSSCDPPVPVRVSSAP